MPCLFNPPNGRNCSSKECYSQGDQKGCCGGSPPISPPSRSVIRVIEFYDSVLMQNVNHFEFFSCMFIHGKENRPKVYESDKGLPGKRNMLFLIYLHFNATQYNFPHDENRALMSTVFFQEYLDPCSQQFGINIYYNLHSGYHLDLASVFKTAILLYKVNAPKSYCFLGFIF